MNKKYFIRMIFIEPPNPTNTLQFKIKVYGFDTKNMH